MKLLTITPFSVSHEGNLYRGSLFMASGDESKSVFIACRVYNYDDFLEMSRVNNAQITMCNGSEVYVTYLDEEVINNARGRELSRIDFLRREVHTLTSYGNLPNATDAEMFCRGLLHAFSSDISVYKIRGQIIYRC